MSIGEIRLGPNHPSELALADFAGPILIMSLGSHLKDGLNVNLVLFGLPIFDFALLLLAPVAGAVIALERMWNDAKGVALITSHVKGSVGAGVGLMAGTAWVG